MNQSNNQYNSVSNLSDNQNISNSDSNSDNRNRNANAAQSNLAIISSRTQFGMSAIAVDVEVHLANGLPAFNVVGMPETAVKESKDRVRSAITSSRFEFPARRITVNLAPADVPKIGGRFDLPIALGILIASGQIQANSLSEYEIIGELALTGEVKAVSACLPTAIACQKDGKKLILPQFSSQEANFVEGLKVYATNSLSDAAAHLSGQALLNLQKQVIDYKPNSKKTCLSEVKGQVQAKRALEIAASGGHHLLMSGSPGCGKTMLASRLPALLPQLLTQDALDTASIYSVSNLGFDVQDWKQRPFRSPHHSASAIALIGGGSKPKPGEISLAHNGVLFLDELPEFPRHALDQLREPIESGYINIVRANSRVTYLSDFQLIAAMNPCKCGYYGDQSSPEKCKCSQSSIESYRNRISGPLLDRIDLHINLSRINIADLQNFPKGESSIDIAKRVEKSQNLQHSRQRCLNSKLEGELLEKNCFLTQDIQELLIKAESRFNLSARGYTRVLKVARTIADLNDESDISQQHIMEALNYRQS